MFNLLILFSVEGEKEEFNIYFLLTFLKKKETELLVKHLENPSGLTLLASPVFSV